MECGSLLSGALLRRKSQSRCESLRALRTEKREGPRNPDACLHGGETRPREGRRKEEGDRGCLIESKSFENFTALGCHKDCGLVTLPRQSCNRPRYFGTRPFRGPVRATADSRICPHFRAFVSGRGSSVSLKSSTRRVNWRWQEK